MPEIVQVVFENRYKPGTFGGNRFSYIADYPLEVGDVVTVPTKFGESSACVCRINVPAEEIGCKLDMIRHIEAPGTVNSDLFGEFFN